MAKKRCSWPVIILVLCLLVVAALLIWLFVPFSSAVKRILPDFNETKSPSVPPAPTPVPALSSPTVAPTSFRFSQCQSVENCCNGLESICDLRVNEVMFATVHNAFSDRMNGFLILPNNNRPLEEALEAGYRGINIDICNCGGSLVLCHGFCQLGSRRIDRVFTNIVSFLEANPTEVIIVPIQINENQDGPVSLIQVNAIFQTIPNLLNMTYIHDPTATNWPTMRTLVSNNKRILFFHYNGPTCLDASECPPGFHYWWDYAGETEFDFVTVGDIRDNTTRSCRITRGAGGTLDFFGVNNFLRFPAEEFAAILSTTDFLNKRIDACSNQTNLGVNLVLVDFWGIGDLLQVVQTRNAALRATPITAQPTVNGT